MSGGRFSRRRGDVSQQPLLPASTPTSPTSPSAYNVLTSSDPPLRRSRNLPANSKSPPLSSSPLALSSASMRSPALSPSSPSSPSNTRFSRKNSAQSERNEPAHGSASPRRSNGLGRPSAKDQQAAAMQAQQNMADWNNPRKRGQTPVSEAKFYQQMEIVSPFIHMLLAKERETAMFNGSVQNTGNNNLANMNLDPHDEAKDFPTLDLLSPDFEGKRKIVVKQDILASEKAGDAAPDLINLSPQLPPSRGGRFGVVSTGVAKENPSNNGGSYGLFGLYGMSGGGTGLTYAPLEDNRKLKNTLVDVKYSHVPELDEIEVEMSFLLQSATNAVIDIIPKDILKQYLDILVFFGSRSGLWCRHVLVKLSEHLEIESFGEEFKKMPLYLFKMEYSMEGVWAAAEIIFSKMMKYVTLDHLLLNLQKKCTPESYDNIVRIVHVCLPLEAEGAAKPENLLAQTQEENDQYFRFLFTDLWNLHPVLHPAIVKRLDSYLIDDRIKTLLESVDFEGISPYSLTYPDGVKYLQRIQTVQRLDQFLSVPVVCKIVKEARLSEDEKRIQYAHTIITSYSDLMSLSIDVHAKADKVIETMEAEEFAEYVTMLVKTYIDLRGAVMFRHAVLYRLGNYLQHEKLLSAVVKAIGDERQLEVLHHYVLLHTFVEYWEKFNSDEALDIRLSQLIPQAEGASLSASSLPSRSATPSSSVVAKSPFPKVPKTYRSSARPTPPPPATPLQKQVYIPAEYGNDSEPISDRTDTDDEQMLLKGKKPASPPAASSSSSPTAATTQTRAYQRVIRDEDDNDSDYEFLRAKPSSAYVDPVQAHLDMLMGAHNKQKPERKFTEEELTLNSTNSSNSTREHPITSYPPPTYDQAEELRAIAENHLPQMILQPKEPKSTSKPRPEATIIKTRTAPATSQQLAHQLAPSGELPEELQQLVQTQAKHLNFLATQNFTIFPFRKEQAAILIRELQQTVIPALLKAYRMETLVELPSTVLNLHFRFLEDFDILGIPHAQLTKFFFGIVEKFFMGHYEHDVLMAPKTVSHNEELVRRTLIGLRANWIATPVFELLAFRRFAEYLDDATIRRMVHPPSFTDWNILTAYVRLIHSPHVTNIDGGLREIATSIMPTLLKHYAMPNIISEENIRAVLRDSSAQDTALIGKFFESVFDIRFEVLAQPQVFAENPDTFPAYLDYIVFLATISVNVKLLVLSRLRVYAESYSTDLLTRHISAIDPTTVVLSDIDTRTLDETQKRKLSEDLAVLLKLWEYKSFFPKNNSRIDISNREYLDRRLALQNCIWDQYETTIDNDWKNKAQAVKDKSWSMNIWLHNWPATQDQALLLALKESNEVYALDQEIEDGAILKSSRFGVHVADIELDVLDSDDEGSESKKPLTRPISLTWHELEGHPGVMWSGIIFRGVRLRFLKAVDRKSIDAVMGTIGSDVPAHALWRYCGNVREMEEAIDGANDSDLKWGSLVMPVIFVIGNRASPYHRQFTHYQKFFAREDDAVFLCSGTVQPIYIPEQPSFDPVPSKANTKLRGVLNLVSSTMSLFYDTPYIQNANRYATFLSRHMWFTLHAWAIAIYGIIFVWNMVQCSIDIAPAIAQHIMFGMWTLALVFVSFFVEISIAAKSPRFTGPYHPSVALNLVIRAVVLIVLLFFGFGQYYYAKEMMRGHKYRHCMPLGFADFVMINFLSHVQIGVRHFLFNRTYRPERPV